MAKREVVTLVDDLSGEELIDGETVSFGLDRVEYEIDLSDENAKELRNALHDYVEAARRVGGRKSTGRTPKGARSSSARYNRETSAQQREWARGQGFEVSERGRIPNNVVQAWEQAHPTQVA